MDAVPMDDRSGPTHGDPTPGDLTRWDLLADDLDGEAAGLSAAETYAQAADVARAELAGLTLDTRLRGASGREVTVCASGAGPVRGVLAEVGRDWVLLVDGPRETVAMLGAVLSVTGVGPRTVGDPGGAVSRALGVGHVLRRHSRDRSTVRVVLDSGDAFTGTVDAVGADHLELAEHAADELRRAGAVLARRLVPFAALATVARTRG